MGYAVRLSDRMDRLLADSLHEIAYQGMTSIHQISVDSLRKSCGRIKARRGECGQRRGARTRLSALHRSAWPGCPALPWLWLCASLACERACTSLAKAPARLSSAQPEPIAPTDLKLARRDLRPYIWGTTATNRMARLKSR